MSVPTAGRVREPEEARTPRPRRRPRVHVGDLLNQTVLIVLGLLSLFPLYFALVNSVKNAVQYARNPLNLPLEFHWGNYARAWEVLAGPILNTVLIAVASVLLILALSALSAYAFALMDFPGRRMLFGLVFALLLIPGFLTLIPLFLQIKDLGLSNHLAVILPYVAAGQAFTIFVLKAFFEGLPKDLLEAAKVDGANDFFVFSRVVLPLSVPVLVSLGIINVVPIWNDFLLPFLVLERPYQTVTMALVTFQGNAESHTAPDFGALMASYVLAAVPLLILFSFLMRYYIEGLTSGSVKA